MNLNPLTVLAGALLLALTLSRCGQGTQEKTFRDSSSYKDPLIKANMEAARVENEQIGDFIRRYRWDMQATETGIRYMITRHGEGAMASVDRIVELSYTLTLLNGDTVYTSSKDGMMSFQVGKGQVITGMEEAILLFRVGDRAKIIIPSHLAFGLIGDQNKIHHKASLVYDIEFLRMY